MSESSRNENRERDWNLYVGDMITFAEKVLTYTEELDQPRFESSGLNYDATVRNLSLLGEAATRIPLSIREAAAQIPWRQIIATRNRLIHGYLGIDNDTLWSIIQDEIPPLLNELQKLKMAALDQNKTQ
jgi:uncharacterized protein with HEPN domain